jgi:hypothetical protein
MLSLAPQYHLRLALTSPRQSPPAVMGLPIETSALSADGRPLFPLQPRDSWFNAPGMLNTATGRLTRLPSDDVSDYQSMAWLPDGQVVALHIGVRSTLWRFQPVVPLPIRHHESGTLALDRGNRSRESAKSSECLAELFSGAAPPCAAGSKNQGAMPAQHATDSCHPWRKVLARRRTFYQGEKRSKIE